jgi:hypothetical protein
MRLFPYPTFYLHHGVCKAHNTGLVLPRRILGSCCHFHLVQQLSLETSFLAFLDIYIERELEQSCSSMQFIEFPSRFSEATPQLLPLNFANPPEPLLHHWRHGCSNREVHTRLISLLDANSIPPPFKNLPHLNQALSVIFQGDEITLELSESSCEVLH